MSLGAIGLTRVVVLATLSERLRAAGRLFWAACNEISLSLYLDTAESGCFSNSSRSAVLAVNWVRTSCS